VTSLLKRVLCSCLCAIVVGGIHPRALAAATEAQPVVALSAATIQANANQLAEQLGIAKDLHKLSEERAAINAGKPPSIEYVLLKQKLLETLLEASFELRTMTSKLHSEIAQADDLQAVMEERRDRAIRLNTIANFISGGITGIIGGSMKLGNMPSAPPDSIDLAEGVVQTSLAALAYKQQNGERRFVQGVPNSLAKIFDPSLPSEYPDLVWRYLQAVPAESSMNVTRRESLLRHWHKFGVIDRIRPSKDRPTTQVAIAHVSGMHPNHAVTIDLLSTRSAMLHDVESVVEEIDSLLLVLLQSVRS